MQMAAPTLIQASPYLIVTQCLPGGTTNPERDTSVRNREAGFPSTVSRQPSSQVWLNATKDGFGPLASTFRTMPSGVRERTCTTAGDGGVGKLARGSSSTARVARQVLAIHARSVAHVRLQAAYGGQPPLGAVNNLHLRRRERDGLLVAHEDDLDWTLAGGAYDEAILPVHPFAKLNHGGNPPPLEQRRGKRRILPDRFPEGMVAVVGPTQEGEVVVVVEGHGQTPLGRQWRFAHALDLAHGGMPLGSVKDEVIRSSVQ